MKAIFKIYLRAVVCGGVLLQTPILLAATADKQATVKQQLLKLGAEKICNPDSESEMYCEAHTAFVFKTDAVVLMSVQPTAGLLVFFQQEKTGQWVAKKTSGLLDYEQALIESKFSKSSQAYFTQAIAAHLESRKAKSKT